MKVVILAGGKGIRIRDVNDKVPKPLIKVNNIPIILRIMKHYSFYGYKDFIILGGYKVDTIKEYFHKNKIVNDEGWDVEIIDSKVETNTAGRLLWIRESLKNDELFHLTYGDGLSDINLIDLVDFHKVSKSLITLTAVHPKSTFGVLNIDTNLKITSFDEKPVLKELWINGGYMCVNSNVLNYIKGLKDSLETDLIPILIKECKVSAFQHESFWFAMDTEKDKLYLEKIIE